MLGNNLNVPDKISVVSRLCHWYWSAIGKVCNFVPNRSPHKFWLFSGTAHETALLSMEISTTPTTVVNLPVESNIKLTFSKADVIHKWCSIWISLQCMSTSPIWDQKLFWIWIDTIRTLQDIKYCAICEQPQYLVCLTDWLVIAYN